MTDQPSQYWSQSPDSLLAALYSTSDGLSAADAMQRLKELGSGKINLRLMQQQATRDNRRLLS
ncbi:MAG: hypothetical protein H8E90_06620 [Anaerolineales bacterium]|nr:hypothetical protein [Anaerolineales bacterium]